MGGSVRLGKVGEGDRTRVAGKVGAGRSGKAGSAEWHESKTAAAVGQGARGADVARYPARQSQCLYSHLRWRQVADRGRQTRQFATYALALRNHRDRQRVDGR